MEALILKILLRRIEKNSDRFKVIKLCYFGKQTSDTILNASLLFGKLGNLLIYLLVLSHGQLHQYTFSRVYVAVAISIYITFKLSKTYLATNLFRVQSHFPTTLV